MVKSRISDNVIALTLGIIIGGLGWLGVKNFATFFDNFTPITNIIISIAGVLVVTWAVKQMGIKVRNPLRR